MTYNVFGGILNPAVPIAYQWLTVAVMLTMCTVPESYRQGLGSQV